MGLFCLLTAIIFEGKYFSMCHMTVHLIIFFKPIKLFCTQTLVSWLLIVGVTAWAKKFWATQYRDKYYKYSYIDFELKNIRLITISFKVLAKLNCVFFGWKTLLNIAVLPFTLIEGSTRSAF